MRLEGNRYVAWQPGVPVLYACTHPDDDGQYSLKVLFPRQVHIWDMVEHREWTGSLLGNANIGVLESVARGRWFVDAAQRQFYDAIMQHWTQDIDAGKNVTLGFSLDDLIGALSHDAEYGKPS